MIKYLRDEMKQGEWRRHCDAVLGYYGPSDGVSEEGSRAYCDPGSLSRDDVDGWTSEADDVSGCGSRAERSEMACDFITLLRMAHHLKLTSCLLLETSI